MTNNNRTNTENLLTDKVLDYDLETRSKEIICKEYLCKNNAWEVIVAHNWENYKIHYRISELKSDIKVLKYYNNLDIKAKKTW